MSLKQATAAAWSAYTARRWAVAADIMIVAIIGGSMMA
jgi:hypothetical protein